MGNLCDVVAKAKGKCEEKKVLEQAQDNLKVEAKQEAADKFAKVLEEKEAARASGTAARLQELEDEAAATDPPGAVEDSVKQLTEAEFTHTKGKEVLSAMAAEAQAIGNLVVVEKEVKAVVACFLLL